MKVYRVEFDGMASEFHHAATRDQIVKLGFANDITLEGLDVGASITLRTEGFAGGWDKYPRVTFTAHDYVSYKCNCCKQEVPGDGIYDICHLCGWENEPGEGPNDDFGPNHMTLSEGQSNFAEYGHYKPRCSECEAYSCLCA